MVAAAACVAFACLLGGPAPDDVATTASALGLLGGGVAGLLSCAWRACCSPNIRRRPWQLLAAAAFVAISGNVWVAVSGSDPLTSPSLLGELSIGVALLLSIAGLLSFPAARRRGIELILMVLDGVVISGAMLLIGLALVYPRLLDSAANGLGSRPSALLFPALDLVMAAVALLLVIRRRSERAVLVLVAAGFLTYATADLTFAVRVAEGTFEFGTVLDLAWITGYALIALAAWHPSAARAPQEHEAHRGSADVHGTMLISGVLVVAVLAQLGRHASGEFYRVQAVLWLLLVLTAGLRQVLLTYDNARLRQSLERRVSEQTADLRRLARQTEVLLGSVGDGIYGVDADGRLTFVNHAGALALGRSPESLLGTHALGSLRAPNAEAARGCGAGSASGRSYVDRAIRDLVVSTGQEDTYLRADGTTFPVEVTSSPLLDDEISQGAVVVFRDVTQRHEVERLKNEFLSVVSHELRTPLTSIRGSLGLLSGGAVEPLSPRVRSMVDMALGSSERLTRLIEDILDVERLESGTLPMDVRPCRVADLLGPAVREVAGFARQTDVEVTWGPSSGGVMADPDRVVQTLTNLLTNAIKFSAVGSTVRLDAEDRGHEVLFRVRDSGRGIPEEKLESVFERFQQVDSSDARVRGGTGLGLAISRRIVDQHGGRIWAESVTGAGTTVKFTLPAADIDSADPPTPPAFAEPTGSDGDREAWRTVA